MIEISMIQVGFALQKIEDNGALTGARQVLTDPQSGLVVSTVLDRQALEQIHAAIGELLSGVVPAPKPKIQLASSITGKPKGMARQL